jgi:hypothetical protein
VITNTTEPLLSACTCNLNLKFGHSISHRMSQDLSRSLSTPFLHLLKMNVMKPLLVTTSFVYSSRHSEPCYKMQVVSRENQLLLPKGQETG